MASSRWPLIFRGCTAALLAVAVVIAAHREVVSAAGALLAACAFAALYGTGLYAAGVRDPARARTWSGLALFLDVLALTVFLYYSGDLENPMRSLYVLPVVAGAIGRSRSFGLALAGSSTVLFSGMVFLTLLPGDPIGLTHHHLDILEGLVLHDLIRVEAGSEGIGYLLLQFGYLAVLLFGSAAAFGTLAGRIRIKQEEVSREHERMKLLLGTLHEGVVLLQGPGNVLLANRVAREFLDGRSLPKVEQELGMFRRLGDRNEVQFETLTGDRVLSHVLARSTPEGPVVWLFRDTTDQKQLMGRMIHQSKMADLGLLAAGIAHEVGNPLSSMSAILQVLRMRSSPAQLDERLESLSGHVDRITRIVRQVSEFARPSGKATEMVDLVQVAAKANEIFRYHRKSRGITVKTNAPDSPVEVRGIEDQLVQVVLNLLLNAADAAREGETVELDIVRGPEGRRLSVRDRGSGMSRDTLERMFLPFFTTKDQGEGVGLGLFVCDTIARNHGGRFEVESTPGSGTCITLHLPAPSREG